MKFFVSHTTLGLGQVADRVGVGLTVKFLSGEQLQFDSDAFDEGDLKRVMLRSAGQ